MGLATDFDFAAERARVQARLDSAGRKLREAAGEAGSRAWDEFEHAREQAADLAREARRRGRDTAMMAAQQVRRRPASFGLAAVVGIAAVALIASPRLRKLVSELGQELLAEISEHRGAMKF
jgi:ElaB/YqjD/DUF883 family membrane-anchored ribosome-binding protein